MNGTPVYEDDEPTLFTCGTCDHCRKRDVSTCTNSRSPKFTELVDLNDDRCMFWE